MGGLAFSGPTHWRWLLWQYKSDLGRNWFGHLGEIVLCDHLLSGIYSVYLCPLYVKLVWTTYWWPSLNADSQLRIHHGYCGRVSLSLLSEREGGLSYWLVFGSSLWRSWFLSHGRQGDIVLEIMRPRDKVAMVVGSLIDQYDLLVWTLSRAAAKLLFRCNSWWNPSWGKHDVLVNVLWLPSGCSTIPNNILDIKIEKMAEKIWIS